MNRLLLLALIVLLIWTAYSFLLRSNLGSDATESPGARSTHEVVWCMGVTSDGVPVLKRFCADEIAWGANWVWFTDKESGRQVQLSTHSVCVYSVITEGGFRRPESMEVER